jgi:hypothetical protein
MIRKKSTLRAGLVLATVVALSLSILADTIRLKDGSIIKGTITGFSDGRFTVSIGEGSRRRELSLSADEVASIEFDANASSARYVQPDSKSTNVPVSTKAPADVDTDQPKTPPRVTITDNTKTLPPVQSRTDAESKTGAKPVVSTRNSDTAPGKPIELNVRVLADNTSNGWTNSGFVVKKGQRIRITGSGSVSLGKGHSTTPSGLSDLDDPDKLLKSVPTGALLAVIGDDNNDFIYVGSSREFTAARDGALYLGVNEGNLNDNSGAFDVKVEILPDI